MLGFLASAASLVRLAWMVWSKKVGFQNSLDNKRKSYLLLDTLAFREV